MNRREALKKLGAGGAVAVGASAVRVVPAFAFASPTVTVQPSMEIVGDAGVNGFTLRWYKGFATCSGSSTTPNAVICSDYAPNTKVFLWAEDNNQGLVRGVYLWGTNQTPTDGTMNSLTASQTATSFLDLEVVPDSSLPYSPVVNFDQIDFVENTGFRCAYPGRPVRDSLGACTDPDPSITKTWRFSLLEDTTTTPSTPYWTVDVVVCLGGGCP